MSQDHDNPHDHSHDGEPRWKHDGVRVISGDKLDPNTAQTPGMFRQAAINHARVGAQKIWAGTVAIEPNAKTGVHHHGELESVIYVVSGKARMRWGERLEFVAEAGPGHLDMRVYERGSGETMSCGTGVVAAAAAHRQRGDVPNHVVVSVPGGELKVDFRKSGAWLTGPAVIYIRGEFWA